MALKELFEVKEAIRTALEAAIPAEPAAVRQEQLKKKLQELLVKTSGTFTWGLVKKMEKAGQPIDKEGLNPARFDLCPRSDQRAPSRS